MKSIEQYLITENTIVEYKERVELHKSKSWLKTVSAFLNTQGGTLLFGVSDIDKNVVGIENTDLMVEKMTELINVKIEPTFSYQLLTKKEKEKNVIILDVQPGSAPPYYHVDNGNRIAYVRKGSSSVEARGDELNNLILKGLNKSYDMLPSQYKTTEASFTLLAAVFKNQIGTEFQQPKDLISCGLAMKDNVLTNAGALICDQYLIRQSRIFCTHWNGLTKGSVAQDAIDDKEYSGSIISLLNNAETFIKNNSKNRWAIKGMIREEETEYPYTAVREALVNAIIHRDYQILGTEIQIAIFEDRMEIYSPGGMVGGHFIQDMELTQVPSRRRNQIISDMFGRLGFMERRGSGINRILSAYKNSGRKVVFYSNEDSFIVTLPNMLYINNEKNVILDKGSQAEEKVLLDVEIISTLKNLVRNKTLKNILLLAKKFGREGIWSRKDMASVFQVSDARETVIIRILLKNNLITKITRGNYKFK